MMTPPGLPTTGELPTIAGLVMTPPGPTEEPEGTPWLTEPPGGGEIMTGAGGENSVGEPAGSGRGPPDRVGGAKSPGASRPPSSFLPRKMGVCEPSAAVGRLIEMGISLAGA